MKKAGGELRQVVQRVTRQPGTGGKALHGPKYQFCVKNNMYGMYNSIEITIYNW